MHKMCACMHTYILGKERKWASKAGRRNGKLKNGDVLYVDTYVSHDWVYVVDVSDIWVIGQCLRYGLSRGNNGHMEENTPKFRWRLSRDINWTPEGLGFDWFKSITNLGKAATRAVSQACLAKHPHYQEYCEDQVPWHILWEMFAVIFLVTSL